MNVIRCCWGLRYRPALFCSVGFLQLTALLSVCVSWLLGVTLQTCTVWYCRFTTANCTFNFVCPGCWGLRYRPALFGTVGLLQLTALLSVCVLVARGYVTDLHCLVL